MFNQKLLRIKPLLVLLLGGLLLYGCSESTLAPEGDGAGETNLDPAGKMYDASADAVLSKGWATLSTTWNTGDIFAGVGSGNYNVYDNTGAFKETINNGLASFTTGCSFNPGLDSLYTTDFGGANVVVFNNSSPHAIAQTIDVSANGGGQPESVVFNAAGSFYVGHAGGDQAIQEYDAAGVFQAKYNAATGPRGTDWIDLGADQSTMYYTSEGSSVHAFNVVGNSQLADFSGGLTGPAYALRLLPPGDGTGGMLVADNSNVKQLDGSGAVVATYDISGDDSFFALNLDPDGVHFWTGGFATGNFYKFAFAPGANLDNAVTTVSSGAPGALFGLCLKGEPTAAVPDSIDLDIDVKPASDPNSINTKSKGVVPVGILGSATFDVTTIDVDSIMFANPPGGTSPAHDLNDPVVYADHLRDLITVEGDTLGDGYIDLITHFVQRETGLVVGDTIGCLSAAHTDGTPMYGCDAVRVFK